MAIVIVGMLDEREEALGIMKLPAPAYRQAGIPLGRDRHGGASR